jgi:hypothetical protein
MFKGVPKIFFLFPKYLMGLGLEPQSDHLKTLPLTGKNVLKKE